MQDSPALLREPRALGNAEVRRLASVCARLASDHDGERAAAALLATRQLKAHGLTWSDVIARALAPPPAPSRRTGLRLTIAAEIAWLAGQDKWLTSWENTFIASLSCWRGELTERQQATVRKIAERVRRAAAGGAA